MKQFPMTTATRTTDNAFQPETEELRARAAWLERRLDLIAKLVEEAGDIGGWEWDVGGETATVSPLVCSVFEFESPKVRREEWLSRVHPEDRERVSAELQRAVEAGAFEAEYRVVTPSGARRWVFDRAATIAGTGGRPAHMIGIVRDVTGRKLREQALARSQETLQLITDAVPALISYIDKDYRYRFVNKAYEQWFGLAREESVGSRVADVLGEAAFEKLRPFMARALTGEPVVYEDWAPYRTGPRYIHANYIPDKMPGGEVRGFAVLVQDITERKALEKQLFERQKTESIGLLAGGIAHDFNNLLVGVIGNASVLMDMLPPGDPACEFLDEIIKAGEVAAHLTRQMLAYSGRGRFVIEPVVLSEVAREIGGVLRSSIASKKIAVHFQLGPDMPAIEADRGQMEQVLLNLVMNAAEAIGDSVGVVAVETGVREVGRGETGEDHSEINPGRYAYLEVRDTGCGMDEATRPRIFEPFFSTKFTGRGLGLPAVAGIVRGHRGAIQLSTGPGRGTTVRVLFPALA